MSYVLAVLLQTMREGLAMYLRLGTGLVIPCSIQLPPQKELAVGTWKPFPHGMVWSPSLRLFGPLETSVNQPRWKRLRKTLAPG